MHSIMLAVPYGKLRCDGETCYKVIGEGRDYYVLRGGMHVPKQFVGEPDRRRRQKGRRDFDNDDYDDYDD